MNPKNDSKVPPDPNIPDEHLLGKIVEFASPTPEFRCELRKCTEQLEFMAENGVAEVIRRCQIPTGGKRTKLKGVDLVVTWLEEYRKQDEKYMEKKNVPGAKRKPDASLENKTPKAIPSTENSTALETEMPETFSANSRIIPNETPIQSVNGTQAEVASEHRESHSLESVLANLSQVNDRTCTLLTECLGLLQLAHKGVCPDKFRCGEALAKIEQRVAEIQGVQIGISLLGCVKSSPPLNTTSFNKANTLQSTAEVSIPPHRRSTYASVTATSSGFSNKQRDIRREKITAHKLALRCNERSFKMKPMNANGAISSGIIARGFLETLGLQNRRGCVQDVRLDRFGCYYLQIKEDVFQEVSDAIQKAINVEGLLNIKGVGLFRVSPPSKSRVSGKRPIIVNTVPHSWSVSQATDEIWLSNFDMWGYNESSKEDHLAEGIRLNRRLKPHELSETPESVNPYVPTKSLKIYVSHQTYSQIMKDGFLRFDYNFLGVRDFKEKPRTCSRCLMVGSHTADSCRNAPKCGRCGGRHITKDCTDEGPPKAHSFSKEDDMNIDSLEEPGSTFDAAKTPQTSKIHTTPSVKGSLSMSNLHSTGDSTKYEEDLEQAFFKGINTRRGDFYAEEEEEED